MPQYDVLLFDLDGTLSDPFIGIANSINFALGHFGYPQQDIPSLAQYIGPPLDQTFKKLLGPTPQHSPTDLVKKYRERYIEIGFAENTLYNNIPETIASLHAANFRMGICTSKPEPIARKVLDFFNLAHHFEFISGGDIGVEKWQQIEFLLHQRHITQNTVMIGDRNVDLTAAHKNSLKSAGVLWGYGSRSELTNEHPAHLLSQPSDLLQLII